MTWWADWRNIYKGVIVNDSKMVEVKFSLMKRDFVWIGILFVIVGVGFSYAFNSNINDPSIVGHSGEEIMLDGDTVVEDSFCQKTMGHACGFDENDGSGGAFSFDLVGGQHSSSQCESAGGTVVAVTEGDLCRFSGGSCASNWNQYKSYSASTGRACGVSQGCSSSCSVSGHSFSNTAFEGCTYQQWLYPACSGPGDMDCLIPYGCAAAGCGAIPVSIGCY